MDKETEDRISVPVAFDEFPKMKYHPDGRTVIVIDLLEERALGDGWVDSPADLIKAELEAVKESRPNKGRG